MLNSYWTKPACYLAWSIIVAWVRRLDNHRLLFSWSNHDKIFTNLFQFIFRKAVDDPVSLGMLRERFQNEDGNPVLIGWLALRKQSKWFVFKTKLKEGGTKDKRNIR